MAGPCTTVLTPQPISIEEQSRIRDYIDAIANIVDGNDFWVSGRPFFINFDETDEQKNVELDNWVPQGMVGYCAMCNSHCDHVLLASLAFKTADMLDGVISLNGNLSQLTQDPFILTLEGRITVPDYGDYVTVRFMGEWLSHPEFRLIK